MKASGDTLSTVSTVGLPAQNDGIAVLEAGHTGPELFQNANWVAVQVGQLNLPERYDPIVDQRGIDWRPRLDSLRRVISEAANAMPTHGKYVRKNCRAEPPVH